MARALQRVPGPSTARRRGPVMLRDAEAMPGDRGDAMTPSPAFAETRSRKIATRVLR